MNVSDIKLLNILIAERDKLLSSAKPYHHQSSIDKLTKSIVDIRNTQVYAAMPERIDTDGIDMSKTIVLKRGESITLRPF